MIIRKCRHEQIDEIHNEIEHLLALWETYSEQIDH